MAVKVARGTITRLRENREGGVVQVREASDYERASRALDEARQAIWDLGTDSTATACAERVRAVSGVIEAPDGPAVVIDLTWLSDELIAQVPEVVAAHLQTAGVADATVASPPGGRDLELLDLRDEQTDERLVVPTCTAYAFSQPPQARRGGPPPMPEGWERFALAWMAEIPIMSASVDFQVSLRGDAEVAKAMMAAARATDRHALLRHGEARTKARVAGVTHPPGTPRLTVAYGGLRTSVEERVAAARQAATWCSSIAPPPFYAFVVFDPDFNEGLGARFQRAGEAPYLRVNQLCDEVVLDGYWYQILGPGHLARLGGPPPGSRPLAEGRVELIVGEPEDWANGGPERARLRDRARKLFGPCLLSDKEMLAMEMARADISDEEADRRIQEIRGH